MLIEEIIRSCVSERVAEAAVASIGYGFTDRIAVAAVQYDMSVGAYVVVAVNRFAKHGDEAELRSVRLAMKAAQEPLLAGLHRILCIMLAAGPDAPSGRSRLREPRLAAQLCAMEAEARHQSFHW